MVAMDEHDEQVTRCPRVGDFVPFKYCRSSGAPFCWVIIECWAGRIDIGQYLADHFSAPEFERGLARPEGGKIGRMVELAKHYGPKEE